MKRMFATTTLGFALLGLAACKGGAGESIKLIPEGATVVGGMNVKSLMSSKTYADNKAMLDEAGGKNLEAIKGCFGGSLDAVKGVVFGMEVGEGSNGAGVFTIDGIGTKEKLDCLGAAIKESTGQEPWTVEDSGKTLKMMGGEAMGFVVNDNTLAVASKAWAPKVKELIDGKGTAAVDGSLKAALGRADTSKTMWAAGKFPKMAADKVQGAEDFATSMDLGSGLALAATVGFADAEKAEAAVKMAEGLIGMGKEQAIKSGVPESVIDAMKFKNSGKQASLDFKVSQEDVDKLIKENKDKLPM